MSGVNVFRIIDNFPDTRGVALVRSHLTKVLPGGEVNLPSIPGEMLPTWAQSERFPGDNPEETEVDAVWRQFRDLLSEQIYEANAAEMSRQADLPPAC